MIDLNKLTNELKRDEGLRLKPYYDTMGVLTIGYGRSLEKGITEAEATYLLSNDIQSAIEDAGKFEWFEGLSPVRKHVILNMLFNLGLGRFKTFKKMIRAIEISYFKRAALELLDSRYANQVGNRVLRLSKMLENGD